MFVYCKNLLFQARISCGLARCGARLEKGREKGITRCFNS